MTFCRRARSISAALFTAALLLVSVPAGAAIQDIAVCDSVAEIAAQQSGVPVSVLRAITRAETGRRMQAGFLPWPWTVNMEGQGFWFDTKDEALAYVYKEFERGARSFDVGCFQINFKWHGQNFASIEAMFDPVTNALYAAKYLTELRAETGDWSKAAGAYHSRTPEFADRYAARFDAFRAGFLAQDGTAAEIADIPEIPDIVLAAYGAQAPAAPRVNRFPLLQNGAAGGLGSLVPLDHGLGTGLLAAPARAMVD